MTTDEAMALMGEAVDRYRDACRRYDEAKDMAARDDSDGAWIARGSAHAYRDACEQELRQVAAECAVHLYDELTRLRSLPELAAA